MGKSCKIISAALAATGVGAVILLASPTPAEAACTTPILCRVTTTTTLQIPVTTTSIPVPPLPTVPGSPVPVAPLAHDGTQQNAVLLALMNKDRSDHGLPPFQLRGDISAIALAWSRDMAQKQVLSHNDAYFSSANRAALGAGAMAENVALNNSVAGAELAFMNSPHHRANILDPRLTVVGLGIRVDSRGMYWVTQDFIQPRGAPVPVTTTAARPPRPATEARPRSASRPSARPTVATSPGTHGNATVPPVVETLAHADTGPAILLPSAVSPAGSRAGVDAVYATARRGNAMSGPLLSLALILALSLAAPVGPRVARNARRR